MEQSLKIKEQQLNALKKRLVDMEEQTLEITHNVISKLTKYSILKKEAYFNINYFSKERVSFTVIFEDDERYHFSSFELYVYADRVEINSGTIGNYGSKETYQIARDYLIVQIWEHEKEIIEAVNSVVDFELKRKIENTEFEILDIKSNIRNKKFEEGKKEILETLKKSIGKKLRYGNGVEYKIINITEKSVIIRYLETERTYREKIDNYLANLYTHKGEYEIVD